MTDPMMDRRTFTLATALAAAGAAHATPLAPPLTKTIPSTGEPLPAIGMGSWRTFDIGEDRAALEVRKEVLRAFFAGGGRLIDSSPMYGSSQGVIGACLETLGGSGAYFSADKVWTPGSEDAPAQIERSQRRWGVERFDLLAVHNLVDWRRHLATLFQMKAEGRLRYVGVTSYAGLRYDEMERIMAEEPIDFVQLTYNIADREAEARLLPLAKERGVAVIANRPFREGGLFSAVAGKALPRFAAETGAANWAQFLLKFIISHTAITVAIPATRRVDHMQENIGAMAGPVPDAALRKRMADAFGAL